MRIIPYEDRYRDDMIFMVLEAKDALGRVPGLNEDLLDIPGSYLAKGDMFWLALDENDRVVGCIGYNTLDGDTVRLHRLYVKASRKRQGIGTRLLQTAEAHIRSRGKHTVTVHLGGKEYFESRSFYPKHGYWEYAPGYMKKVLEPDIAVKIEKSCGAVVFTRVGGQIKYVLVQQQRGFYGFPKGHMEPGETERETALREIYEEVGLRVTLLDGFVTTDSHMLTHIPGVRKDMVYFLGEYADQEIVFQQEELLCAKLVTFDEAMELFQFDSAKRILGEAREFLAERK